ncbi:hypothetical protein Tco_1300878 [Tanacetum coccineum]
MPVQTRRQLAQILKCVCSSSPVSIVEPKNIKEAKADSCMREVYVAQPEGSLIRSLEKVFTSKIYRVIMFTWTSSRPDLVHAVCFCARYQARPNSKDLKEFKESLDIPKGLPLHGLCSLGDMLVSWMSKETELLLQCLSRGSVLGVSASYAQVMLDEDTA